MSSFWNTLYASIMSPAIFTRMKNLLSGSPNNINAAKSTPEQDAKDQELLEKAVSKYPLNNETNSNGFFRSMML